MMNTKMNIKKIVSMQKAFCQAYESGLLSLTTDLAHVRSNCASQVAPIDQWAFRQTNDVYDEYTVLAHGLRWLALVNRESGDKLE